MAQGSLFHSVRVATAKLHIPMGFFGLVEVEELVEELRGQMWELAEIYCLESEKIAFTQYTVLNGEPVCSLCKKGVTSLNLLVCTQLDIEYFEFFEVY